jgi:hypothetical protein
MSSARTAHRFDPDRQHGAPSGAKAQTVSDPGKTHSNAAVIVT